MKNLEDIFYHEAVENINQLEENLLSAKETEKHNEIIDSIFRIVHSLKGSAAIFDFQNISALSHHFENLFSDLRKKNSLLSDEIIQIGLQTCDIFRILLEKKENTEIQNQIDQIQKKISYLTQKKALFTETEHSQQISEEKKLYIINFTPQIDILKDGTNPLFLLEELHEYGDTLVLSHQNLPKLSHFAIENCYYQWQAFVYSAEQKTVFRDVFLFVSKEHKINIESMLPPENFDFTLFEEKIKAAYKNQSFLSINKIEDILQNAHKKIALEEKIDRFKQESKITTLNVDSSQIDTLFNIMSEIIIHQTYLNSLAEQINLPQLKSSAKEIDDLSRRLRETVYDISLVPFKAIIARLKRLIFDLSINTGKQIKFEINDANIKLDKTLLDNIIDPIIHLLRNAVDHGIESPKERIKKEKSPEGKISLKLEQSNKELTICISDDGNGINLPKIKKRAIEKSLISPDNKLTDQDLIQLIFRPGFTTAENITKISGRGVGMDVVQKNIEKLRGNIEVETKENTGTNFIIKLPLSMAIQDGLIFTTGSYKMVLPSQQVFYFASIKKEELTKIYKNVILFKNEEIPIYNMAQFLQVKQKKRNAYYLLILNEHGQKNALIVDNIIGFKQFVIKSLGKYYQRLSFLSGVTSLGNGEIALFLDAERLLSFIKSRMKVNLEI